MQTEPTWQQHLAQAIRCPQQLAKRLQLSPDWAQQVQAACRAFELKVPEPYCQRIEPGNPDDPLLLQVLPQAQEMIEQPGYSQDPVGDQAANPLPGLLHKYQGRVLLTLTGSCSINCRYCFRRHFPYQDNNPRADQLTAIEHYLRQDASIDEVILSGGEPLLMKDEPLQALFERLAAIPHLRRLRIHTRLPIAIPQRVQPSLIRALQATRLHTIVVIHCNHPHEIDTEVSHALQQLHHSGSWCLNQSVLLKGINDNVETLVALSQALMASRVQPYYLHLLDRVQGAAHFEVDRPRAVALHTAMQAHLPGYAVPQLVTEQAGQPAKTRVATNA